MESPDARAFIEGVVRGAQDYLYILAGVESGLFDVITRHGAEGVTAATLAEESGLRPDYVRIWSETAYTIGVLEATDGGWLRLSPSMGALLSSSEPRNLVPMLRLHGQWLGQLLELGSLLRSGDERPGFEGTFRREVAVGILPALRAQARGRIDRIYARQPDVAAKLQGGARVLEVGCGTGMQLEALAQTYPKASFVGIDVVAGMLEIGTEAIRDAGLSGRIDFRQVRAESIDYSDEFDIALMNVVMHELRPEIRPAAVGKVFEALRPGGMLVSNDFAYPNTLAEFRDPVYTFGVFDQALELAWGSRHLTRTELDDLLKGVGFAGCTFEIIDDLPFPGMVRPGSKITYLSTVARKGAGESGV